MIVNGGFIGSLTLIDAQPKDTVVYTPTYPGLLRRSPELRIHNPKTLLRNFDYKTTGEKEQIVKDITDNHRLDMFGKSLLVKTNFEYIVTLPLVAGGVFALYEPFALPLGTINGKPNFRYTPDFLLPYNYKEDRPVIIEPHGFYDKNRGNYLNKSEIMTDLKKFKTARESYGLYIVLISFDKFPLDKDVVRQHVDEFWVGNYDGLKGRRDMKKQVKDFVSTTQTRQVSSVGNIIDSIRANRMQAQA